MSNILCFNPFITVLKCLMSAECRDVGETSRLILPFAVLCASRELSKSLHETLSLNRVGCVLPGSSGQQT